MSDNYETRRQKMWRRFIEHLQAGMIYHWVSYPEGEPWIEFLEDETGEFFAIEDIGYLEELDIIAVDVWNQTVILTEKGKTIDPAEIE